jgi:hypothetical protein
MGDDKGVVCTDEELSFLDRGRRPTTLKGKGKGSVLRYVGPMNQALFDL